MNNSPGRSHYFVIFKDDFSGWCEVHFMKNKSKVPDFFRKFVALCFKTQQNATVRILRSDNDGKYTSREFEEWLAEQGIRHEKSALYSPQQVCKCGYSKSNLVCLLNQCLCGLKQAPRVWNQHFDSFLQKFGLKSTAADPCIYFRREEKEITIMCIGVEH